MPDIVYFDLETQRTANDAGGWHNKHDMKMSVGVTYSTASERYRIYSEPRVNELIDQLLKADLVVGFNILNFDYEVLMGYTILDLPHQLRTLDILVEVEKRIGSKPNLDNLAMATLGDRKPAGGVDAIKWWREKRVLDIAEYCCFDVKVTKMMHEFGVTNRELFYTDKFNRRQKMALEWQCYSRCAQPERLGDLLPKSRLGWLEGQATVVSLPRLSVALRRIRRLG
jgi:hypothetical protein